MQEDYLHRKKKKNTATDKQGPFQDVARADSPVAPTAWQAHPLPGALCGHTETQRPLQTGMVFGFQGKRRPRKTGAKSFEGGAEAIPFSGMRGRDWTISELLRVPPGTQLSDPGSSHPRKAPRRIKNRGSPE